MYTKTKTRSMLIQVCFAQSPRLGLIESRFWIPALYIVIKIIMDHVHRIHYTFRVNANGKFNCYSAKCKHSCNANTKQVPRHVHSNQTSCTSTKISPRQSVIRGRACSLWNGVQRKAHHRQQDHSHTLQNGMLGVCVTDTQLLNRVSYKSCTYTYTLLSYYTIYYLLLT